MRAYKQNYFYFQTNSVSVQGTSKYKIYTHVYIAKICYQFNKIFNLNIVKVVNVDNEMYKIFVGVNEDFL